MEFDFLPVWFWDKDCCWSRATRRRRRSRLSSLCILKQLAGSICTTCAFHICWAACPFRIASTLPLLAACTSASQTQHNNLHHLTCWTCNSYVCNTCKKDDETMRPSGSISKLLMLTSRHSNCVDSMGRQFAKQAYVMHIWPNPKCKLYLQQCQIGE